MLLFGIILFIIHIPKQHYCAMPLTLRLKSIREVALYIATIRYEYFWALVRVDIVLHSPNSYNNLTK